jgi:hypothetical protein
MVGAEQRPDVLGVGLSERAVNPARSQNSTVTTRRSSIPAPEASAAPHRPQNANPPGTSAPQDGQLTMGSVSR